MAESLKYIRLSDELQERIRKDREQGQKNPYACLNDKVIRRDPDRDRENLWRPSYVRDIEKIMHSPYYNRYTDKTQVFSFYRNDDITRRSLHVQLVSRIARNIGSILGLNDDLIEAIALGHDIGHTPFGHEGEYIVNTLYHAHTGRYFNHNVHSVRVLDGMFRRNISLQTLDGILCHNGEFEMQCYCPRPLDGFAEYDNMVESCYQDADNIGKLVPSTLEGCVVRICDMIAYLGKDRQDARRAGLPEEELIFSQGEIGIENSEMTNNLIVNIIENSYGKGYILLDEAYYKALKMAKDENYRYIYKNDRMKQQYDTTIRPMFEAVYDCLLKDIRVGNRDSVIYRHHISFVEEARKYYNSEINYEDEEPNQIIVDYLASMTDDYFIDLYHHLFPKGEYTVPYVPYF